MSFYDKYLRNRVRLARSRKIACTLAVILVIAAVPFAIAAVQGQGHSTEITENLGLSAMQVSSDSEGLSGETGSNNQSANSNTSEQTNNQDGANSINDNSSNASEKDASNANDTKNNSSKDANNNANNKTEQSQSKSQDKNSNNENANKDAKSTNNNSTSNVNKSQSKKQNKAAGIVSKKATQTSETAVCKITDTNGTNTFASICIKRRCGQN